MNRLIALIIAFLVMPLFAVSQEIEMADGLYQNGKIYVVITVISIILAGLFGYIFYLDKKVSKKEDSNKA